MALTSTGKMLPTDNFMLCFTMTATPPGGTGTTVLDQGSSTGRFHIVYNGVIGRTRVLVSGVAPTPEANYDSSDLAGKRFAVVRAGEFVTIYVNGVEVSMADSYATDLIDQDPLTADAGYVDFATIQIYTTITDQQAREDYAQSAGLLVHESPLLNIMTADAVDDDLTSLLLPKSGQVIVPDVMAGRFHGLAYNGPGQVQCIHPDGFRAFSFDGLADYIDIGQGIGFGSSAGTGFTVDTWVRSHNNSQAQCIIGGVDGDGYGLRIFSNLESDGATVTADCLYAAWTDGGGVLMAGGVNTAIGLYESSGAEPSLRHLRVTFDYTGEKIYAWLDGNALTFTLESTGTVTPLDFQVSLYVGARNNNGVASHYFDGLIGPVSIQLARTPTVIAQRAFEVGRPVIRRSRFRQLARSARPHHLVSHG